VIRHLRAIAFVILAASAFAGIPNRSLAQGTDTILILDASGSMWGVVDGQTKIAAARQAVGTILSKWKASDRLGLLAYGHRSKGDCRDIELLVPVGAFNPDAIRAAVGALNPKGRTPIADSLRAAASALRTTENKATVILVSDGIETCAPDPCAVAGELKKSGIGFTAHVIGFDVADPVAKNQLQCIARVTGGVYLDARNPAALENAMGRVTEAAQGTKVPSEAPPRPPAEDPFMGKNIRGVARLAAGLDPISDERMGWVVYKRNAAGERGEYHHRLDGSPFAGTIDPGSYIVEIEYGQVKREVPLVVERGKTASLDVVLNAAYVTSEGSVIGGAKLEQATWEMHDGKGTWIATEYQAVPRFVLGAGDYILRLTRGNSKAEKPFTVAAGDAINVALALDAGRLIVSGAYAPNGPKVDKGFTVEVRQLPKPDAEQGEWVATNYEPTSQFDLPTGQYDVVVSVGAAKKIVRADVRSGTPTRLNVNLEAGVLGLRTAAGKAIEIVVAERDINNARKSVHISYEPDLNLALNAGDYVAIVEFSGNRKVEKPFSVTAGKRVEVEVNP
jgi:Ca-activated chloride channel homolog